MKITENVTIYQCEYCKKKLFRKYAMEKHEKFCSENPSNIPVCFGCIFLESTTIDTSYQRITNYEGDIEIVEQESSGFRCSKININLYHPKVIKMNLLKLYPETFENQEPMKMDCELRNGNAESIEFNID